MTYPAGLIIALESQQNEGSDSGKVLEASQTRHVSKLRTKALGVALPARRTLLNLCLSNATGACMKRFCIGLSLLCISLIARTAGAQQPAKPEGSHHSDESSAARKP